MFRKFIISFLAAMLFSGAITAQEKTDPIEESITTDFTVNVLNLLIWRQLEVDLENSLSKDVSLGFNFMIAPLLESRVGTVIPWHIRPHLRFYPGRGFAKGFFIDANIEVMKGRAIVLNNSRIQERYLGSSKIILGYGVSMGVKLISGDKMTIVIGGGIGRNTDADRSSVQILARTDFAIGFRF